MQCDGLPAVTQALLVLRAPQAADAVVQACWPQGSAPSAALLGSLKAVLASRKPSVQRLGGGEAGSEDQVLMCQPVAAGGKVVGALGVSLSAATLDQARAWKQRLRMACVKLVLSHPLPLPLPLQPPAHAGAGAGTAPPDEASQILEAITEMLRCESTAQAPLALVRFLAERSHCLRVSLGLFEPATPTLLRLVAQSDADEVDSRGDLARLLQGAMEECLHQRSTVAYPPAAGRAGGTDLAHSLLARQGGDLSVCSVPVAVRGQLLGAVTWQREGSQPFGADDLARLENLVVFVAPVLRLLRNLNSRWAQRLLGGVRSGDARAPLWRRTWPVAAAAGLGLLACVPLDHSVSASARLEGAIERAIVAPQDGYIARALVRPGDRVAAGQPLAEFELEPLLLEQQRVGAELAQAEGAFGEALQKNDRAQLAMAASRVDQARSRLDLLAHDIARAQLLAPFDALVISGDLTRAVGAPVKRGDVLMTLAPASGHRLMLWVDERDIDAVHEQQSGQLLLAAQPDQALALRVQRITPAATTRDGSNGFEVEARLVNEASAGLRPGLEGVARLEAGRAAAGWQLVQRAWGWAQRQWWAWAG